MAWQLVARLDVDGKACNACMEPTSCVDWAASHPSSHPARPSITHTSSSSTVKKKLPRGRSTRPSRTEESLNCTAECRDGQIMTCDATIITGTGRTGTTFLVALLTLCGAPTGFNEKEVNHTVYGTAAHAGLEVAPAIRNGVIVCTQNPNREVFKGPQLADERKVQQWMNATNLHTVIVPMRPLEDAARSREFQTKHHDPHRGGFTHANSVPSQISYFEHSVNYLMWQLSRHVQIETITLSYPEHVLDWKYSYSKLLPVLNRYNISMERFKSMHTRLSQKSFVHSFSAAPDAKVEPSHRNKN